jgi:hypothetical protein
MRRLIVPILVAAFAVGCGERAALPSSPLSPGAASHDIGTPPPPPISGDGRADLDVFAGDNSSTDCSASVSFPFAFEYFVNNPGKNAFLHMHVDGQGLDVAVHQTNKKIDTKGDLSGPGFTFSIQNTLGGEITSSAHPVLNTIVLQLSGTLTQDGHTCTANATLTASLGHTTHE